MLVGLRRDAHHLAAAPGGGADIGVGEIVQDEKLAADRVDLLDRVGNGEIEKARALEEALGVLAQMKDLAAVGALAFEHAARVVEAVGQHVDLGVGPIDKGAVEPDFSGHLIERNARHSHILQARGAFRAVRISLVSRRAATIAPTAQFLHKSGVTAQTFRRFPTVSRVARPQDMSIWLT